MHPTLKIYVFENEGLNGAENECVPLENVLECCGLGNQIQIPHLFCTCSLLSIFLWGTFLSSLTLSLVGIGATGRLHENCFLKELYSFTATVSRSAPTLTFKI